ncbi:MAG: lipopolysaccharide biosynthesis protein [Flavobacteriales bacterium]
MQKEVDNIRASSFIGKFKFLMKDFALYGLVGMLSRLMGIFMIPVIARVFEPAQYGVVDNIRVVYEISIALCLLGLNSAVGVFMFQTEDPEERKSIVSEGMITTMVFCLFVCLILFFSADLILGFFSIKPGAHTLEFRMMVLTIPFSCFSALVMQLLKWNFRRIPYTIMSVGGPVILVVVTLFFILKLKLGLVGIFYGQLASSSIIATIGFFFCKDNFIVPKRFVHLPQMMGFALPALVTNLLSNLMPAVDRRFIGQYLSSSDMGTYALGERFSRLINIITGALNVSWGPFSLSIYKEKDAELVYSRIFTVYVVAMTSIGFFILSIVRPLIILFASEKYINSLQIIPFLLFGLIIESFAEFLGLGILISRKNYYNALSYVVHLLVSVLLMSFLIEPFGIIGLGLSFIGGRFALVTSKHIFSIRAYNLKIPIAKQYCVVFVAILIILLLEQYFDLTALQKGIAYGFFGIANIFVGFFVLLSKDDINSIKQKFKARKKAKG